MWVTMLVLLIGLVAGIPWMLSHYVHRLPYAPECPHCRAVTGQPRAHGFIDRACALLAATPVRTCARCGWAGRMRWRLAQERVRGQSTQGR
jgi:hypothetical protein